MVGQGVPLSWIESFGIPQTLIEKVYNKMYYGNIQKYFEEEKEEEKETIEYNIKDKLQEKDYYYNKKSTTTQIYIRLKYLYSFNEDYYNNKNNIVTDFEFLKNNLKFYQIFKPAIKKFIIHNKQKICRIIEKVESGEKVTKQNIQRIK